MDQPVIGQPQPSTAAPHPEWPEYTSEDQRLIRLGIGAELGAAEVDGRDKLELLGEHLLRLAEAMKLLREGEVMEKELSGTGQLSRPHGCEPLEPEPHL